MNNETCVCCGNIIPEGRQVCLICEGKYAKYTTSEVPQRYKKSTIIGLLLNYCRVHLFQ